MFIRRRTDTSEVQAPPEQPRNFLLLFGFLVVGAFFNLLHAGVLRDARDAGESILDVITSRPVAQALAWGPLLVAAVGLSLAARGRNVDGWLWVLSGGWLVLGAANLVMALRAGDHVQVAASVLALILSFVTASLLRGTRTDPAA